MAEPHSDETKKQQAEAAKRREGARGKPQDDEPDFEAMSHEELMNYAREHGLEGLSSDMTDEEIVQVLRGKV